MQESAERLRAGIAADHAAREALTAATLADDKARSELAALTTRIAERQELLADRPGAEETRALLDEHRRLDERATLARSRAQQGAVPGSRPRPYGTVGGPSSRPRGHCCCRCATGSPDSAYRPSTPMTCLGPGRSWRPGPREQAGRRRADLVDLAARLERLDGDLGERFSPGTRSAGGALDRPTR